MPTISKYDTLPGSSLSANDLDCDGANIKDTPDGGKHVTIWKGQEDGPYRYSYEIDRDGNYKPGTAHYTDAMSHVLQKMGHKKW